jgi:hypothetical protein
LLKRLTNIFKSIRGDDKGANPTLNVVSVPSF